jgi:hypothetical protein
MSRGASYWKLKPRPLPLTCRVVLDADGLQIDEVVVDEPGRVLVILEPFPGYLYGGWVGVDAE